MAATPKTPDYSTTAQNRRTNAMELAVSHFHSDPNTPASALFSVAEAVEEYIRSGEVPNFPSAAPREFPDPPKPTLQSVPVRDIPPG